ncbi:MAG TPA: hypothetical protein VLD65_13825 [Anaerolineales bacterium]|nr:hypothetical protein [Anaerolineales bacterium]
MKTKKVTTVFIVAMLVILVGVVPAAAKAVRVDYVSTGCIVYQGPPERFWISEDAIVHMRGITFNQVDTSTNDYDNGTATLIANIDMNPITGYGHAYGSVTIYPTAYDGTWVGQWSTHRSPDGLKGSMTARGTGELEGLLLFNDMRSTDPTNPCTDGYETVLIP